VTGAGDLPAMAGFLSPEAVEQLLAGTSVPENLDAGDARVARLLSAMHSHGAQTASGNELQEHHAVTAIVEAIREAPQPLAAHRRSHVLPHRMSAKAAVATATFVTLLAGGTAAAATGSLPVPAQSAVSSALAHVGVSVPEPNSHANPHATNKTHRGSKPRDEATDGDGVAEPTNAKGPDATGPAKFGLCQAWAATPTPNANSGKRDSVAFTNLQEAADAADKSVDDYCTNVTPPTGDDEATTTPPTPKHAKPSTGGPKQPDSDDAKGGPSTGDDHSDGASANGTSHAPDAPPTP
jgi:hypothetical protein